MGALAELFVPYANEINKGGDGLIEGFNKLCYVTMYLKPYPEEDNKKGEL